jgi:hypothetical protein
MVRPVIKGKRHFVKHTTDKGRSAEYPDCIFRDTLSIRNRVQCGHPDCGDVVKTCYVKHFTAKNIGWDTFTNISACPLNKEKS